MLWLLLPAALLAAVAINTDAITAGVAAAAAGPRQTLNLQTNRWPFTSLTKSMSYYPLSYTTPVWLDAADSGRVCDNITRVSLTQRKEPPGGQGPFTPKRASGRTGPHFIG